MTFYRLDKIENVAYDDNRKEELLKLMKMIYAKSNEERLEIAEGSEILMDLAQVMKEFVNNESVLKFKSLVGKHEEIARRNGRREGIQEGKREGRASGLAEGTQYNVPISVDTIRRRYPIKWTYQEGIETLIVDTKIWVF